MNRPGGFIITDRALALCNFRPWAKVLDLGCGSGVTVDYLEKKHSIDAFGIDTDASVLPKQQQFALAHAEDIPFPIASIDGVLMECSFSMMEDQQLVLSECYRVLNPGGKLIISDMYSHGEPARLKGCLGRIDRRETITQTIESAGFIPQHFEDFSSHLKAFWGQMIFEKGAKSFYCDLGTVPETLKGIKCGYYLLVAEKTKA